MDADDIRALSALVIHGCCMLATGVRSGWVGHDGAVGAHPPPRAPLATFAAAPGDADYVLEPERVVGRRLAFPALNAPALRLAVRGAVLGRFRDIRAATDEHGLEQAGVVVWDGATATLAQYHGDSAHDAVVPFCNGRRRSAVPEVREKRAERALAEWHSHPQAPGHDFLPPSDADLYQMVLAALKGTSNMGYVLAPEGVYECRVEPALCFAVRRDTEVFLGRHGWGTDTDGVFQRCEQPVPERVRQMAPDDIPHLHRLFTLPGTLFQDLTSARHRGVQDRIRDFCECLRDRLGVHIDFLPPPPP